MRRMNIEMRFPRNLSVFAIALLCGLAACTPNQSPDELKERTAQATATLKVDAKAVAAGVREGWSRDKPLNVNTATREQLLSLPGVTETEADRLIAGRPYHEPGQLVTRRILPQSKYDKIADRLTAKM
jgi:competence protein ComEA